MTTLSARINKAPELFTEILEAINDAIFIADENGNALWLNKASEKMCNLPKEKIIGRNVRELENHGIFTPSVSRMAIEANKDVSTVQIMKKERKYIATGHLIKNKKGDVILTIAHSRDMTKPMENTSNITEIEKLLGKYSEEIRKLTNNKLMKNSNRIELKNKSKERLEVDQKINKIASVDTTVLITGETGTGKSIAAKQIHELSVRRDKPFVELNCASLPESLLESELFGYEKGSFTGASSGGKDGLIKAAESGTLFLDEVGEIPLHLQSKLLHILQNKQYLPIGGREYKSANVRIIVATNRELEKMVEEGTFRSDLFYRMNILTVRMPELRKSKEAITQFALSFLDIFNTKYNLNKSFSNRVIQVFQSYSWPGNLRELENLIERLVILSEDIITEKDLPQKMNPTQTLSNRPVDDKLDKSMPEVIDSIEKKMIIEALNKTNSTRRAAKYLGVSQSLIMRRMKKYEIELCVEKSKSVIEK